MSIKLRIKKITKDLVRMKVKKKNYDQNELKIDK